MPRRPRPFRRLVGSTATFETRGTTRTLPSKSAAQPSWMGARGKRKLKEAAARRGFASPTKQQMGQGIAATEARVRAESQRELLIAEHTQLLQLCEKHSPGVLMAFRGRPLRDGLDAP